MTSSDGDYDHLFKLLLIGDAGVGKSSLLLRFTDGTFDDQQPATIGVDFKVANMRVGGRKLKCTVWDTAGQERFRTLTNAYYRGAQGILLVYDVTNEDSFTHLSTWLDEVDMYCPGGERGVVKLLVGNKVDLEERRRVSFSDGEAWARSKGMLFMETSAKSEVGVRQVFEELIEKILENPALLAGTGPARSGREGTGGGAARREPLRLDGEPETGPGCCS